MRGDPRGRRLVVVTRAPWSQYELLVYAATGSAGLVLSRALLRGRLVPRVLGVVGVVGYAALLAGGVLDVVGVLGLGSTGGSAFFVPGAVFEIALPVWLLVKGFSPAGLRLREEIIERRSPGSARCA